MERKNSLFKNESIRLATININMKKNKLKNQKGYAMLFTIIIVSAISVITAGLSSIAYKQLTLSSLAKDSQVATIWADTANECALFFHQKLFPYYSEDANDPTTWACGGQELEFELNRGEEDLRYSLSPVEDQNSKKNPCFKIVTSQVNNEDGIQVKIESSGYNICDTQHIRSVERSYQINYIEEFRPKATNE